MSEAMTKPMTSEEFFALPDEEGVERWLIDGELKERPMTKRNPRIARATIAVGHLLELWAAEQPDPRPEVVGSEAYFRLRRNPDTNVAIDVAVASGTLSENTFDDAKYFDGPPLLAVEILSPGDKNDDVFEKTQLYLDTGVRAVWVVDPNFRTVTVNVADAIPQLFGEGQQLSGDPYLPGLRIEVRRIFRPRRGRRQA